MLILSRRARESIMIGDDITVKVLSIGKNKVRIGIDAPPNVAAHREEIYVRNQNEEEAAINHQTTTRSLR